MNQQVFALAEGPVAVDTFSFASTERPRTGGLRRPGRAERQRERRELALAETDATYFSRRAREERAFADNAAGELNRSLHLELARRYAELAAAIREADERIG